MNRSAAREKAFKLVYSLEIQKEEQLPEQIHLYLENENIKDEETVKYIESVLIGIAENIDSINKKE